MSFLAVVMWVFIVTRTSRTRIRTRPFQVYECLAQSLRGISKETYARIAISANPPTKFFRTVIMVKEELVDSATTPTFLRPSCWLRMLFLERAQEKLSFGDTWFASIEIINFPFLGNTFHDAIFLGQYLSAISTAHS